MFRYLGLWLSLQVQVKMVIGGKEILVVKGFEPAVVWLDRVVSKIPKVTGKRILNRVGKRLVESIRLNIKADTIYGSEQRGRLGKSFRVESKGPYTVVITSTHPGARAANDGMRTFKRGKFRRRFPGGKWRIVTGRGKVMTKSRAMNFVEHAVIDVTKKMNGIVEKSLKEKGFT